MKYLLFLSLAVIALAAATELWAAGEDKTLANDPGKAKELSGMSIVGNDEAPKSLYIVPWKSSEIGIETGLDMLLDERAVPVDRDVFKRQLDFYEVRTETTPGG